MQLKGQVSTINQSKQGTQVTIDVENDGKVIIMNKATDFHDYTVGQTVDITVVTSQS